MLWKGLHVFLPARLPSSPSGVFFLHHRMGCDQRLVFEQTHLDERSACRANQAKEMFDVSVSKHPNGTENKFRKNNAGPGSGIVSIAAIQEAYATEQRRLAQASSMVDAQVAASGSAGVPLDAGGVPVVQRLVGGVVTNVEEGTPAVVPRGARRAQLLPARGVSRPRPQSVDSAAVASRRVSPKTEQGVQFNVVGEDDEQGAPPEPEVDVADEPEWTRMLNNEFGDLGRELKGAEARRDVLPNGQERDDATLQINTLSDCLMIKNDKAKHVPASTLDGDHKEVDRGWCRFS